MVLKVLYIATAIDFMTFGMAMTVLPLYIFSMGGTKFYQGVLNSASSLVILVSGPIIGSIGDSIGRKAMLLQSFLVASLGNSLLIFSSTLSVIFASRLISSLGSQIMVLIKTLIDDSITEESEKIGAMYKTQAIGSFCFIVGSLIGGYFIEYGLQNYLFVAFTLLHLTNFALVWTLIQEPNKPSTPKPKDNNTPATKLKNVFTLDWSKYWILYGIKISLSSAIGVFNFIVSSYLVERFQVSGSAMGYFYTLLSVTSIAANLSMKKVTESSPYAGDKSGMRRFRHGFVLLMATFLSLSATSSLVVFVLHTVPLVLAQVFVDSTMTEVLLRGAPPSEKGKVVSTFEGAFFLTGLVVPVTCGYVADRFGDSTFLSFVPLAIGLGLTFVANQKLNSEKL